VTTPRVFIDASVLVRYLADDDPPRALAAARLIESGARLVISTAALLEVVHLLRGLGATNPELGEALTRFLTLEQVELVDADQPATVAAIKWTLRGSARRIPDAIIAAAAEYAGCEVIASFDERMTSPTVPVRLL
jgi:predicted nucleic acid-binding protein